MTTCPQPLSNRLTLTRDDPATCTGKEATAPTPPQSWTDEDIVSRVLAGQVEAFELIMRRYNSRLFRVCVSILRNEAEAEDVVQDAYVRAFQHLRQFAGRSMFSTWLTRIAIHEALARAKKLRRQEPLEVDDREISFPAPVSSNPERNLADKEMKVLLETAILSLPDSYREVFVMRDVQDMSTLETAACLGLTEENVKVRLHRARAMLRKKLFSLAGSGLHSAFAFDGERCDRIVARTLARIAQTVMM